MEQLEYIWTDGNNEDFHKFYLETEEYYSKIPTQAMNLGGDDYQTLITQLSLYSGSLLS